MGPPSPSSLEPSLSSRSAAEDTIVEGSGARPQPELTLGRGDPIGRYLLIDPLGRGAMGQVFRAYDPDLDRQVALKILHERTTHGPEARKRLLGEAKAMARIHHPHVVTVYDAGMHEGAVFIAMEIVDGPSLDHWLATPRSPAAILDALTDAARGLAAAHAAGVIHRDFKPANVLVTADGRAKVGDFGLAGIEDPTTNPTTATKPGRAMGTPAYMSPEHFAGVGIDARSDQFSFAIALHEALHGARPFSATTWPELAVQVVSGDVTGALSGRRGGIDGVLRRALAVDPAERFASMGALIAALERARRPVWRRWATVGAVAVALGLVLVGQARDTTEACVPGSERAAAVWSEPAKAALRIGGSDYTEAYANHARARFEQGLDDYAAQWATAYDQSCAVVGAQAQQGTPAQRHTAECLDNRLDSLQGLAELASTTPIDAGRVGELLDTLPDLPDCAEGGWIPYPSDPEAAARAIGLHRELTRIRRALLLDQREHLVEDARAAVASARELAEPYLVARALGLQARTQDGTDADIDPVLEEALELALAGGFDPLAAQLVHDVLLTRTHDSDAAWREIGQLVAMARGLVARFGGDDALLGNLALGEGNALRRAGHLEQAERSDRLAEEHFARARDPDGIARARINQAVTMLRLGRAEEAIPRIRAAVEELERESGMSSPVAFDAQLILAKGLYHADRPREGLVAAAAAYQRAQELYTPTSSTLRQTLSTYAGLAVAAGDAATARTAMVSLRALPNPSHSEKILAAFFELDLLQLEGRHDEVVRSMPAIRAQLDPGSAWSLAWSEISLAKSQFMLGRHTQAHAALVSPEVLNGLGDPEPDPETRTTVVFLAALTDAPPPPGITWRSLLPPTATRERHRLLREVIDALEQPHDPTPTLRRVRDELATTYGERSILVQLLDAWLARAAPGRPR